MAEVAGQDGLNQWAEGLNRYFTDRGDARRCDHIASYPYKFYCDGTYGVVDSLGAASPIGKTADDAIALGHLNSLSFDSDVYAKMVDYTATHDVSPAYQGPSYAG